MRDEQPSDRTLSGLGDAEAPLSGHVRPAPAAPQTKSPERDLAEGSETLPLGTTLSGLSQAPWALPLAAEPHSRAADSSVQGAAQPASLPPSAVPKTPRVLDSNATLDALPDSAFDVGFSERLPPPSVAAAGGGAPNSVAAATKRGAQLAGPTLPPRTARDAVSETAIIPARSDGHSAWLGFACAALVAGGLAAYLGKVDVTATARGSVILEGGVKPVLSSLSGPLVEVAVAVGDRVTVGQTLAKLDVSALELNVQRLTAHLEQLKSARSAQAEASERLFNSSLAALQRKRALLLRREKLLRNEGKAAEPRPGLNDALLDVRQQIVEVDVELNDRRQRYDAEQATRDRELTDLASERGLMLGQISSATIQAPFAGRIESVGVSRGQNVLSGETVLTISPADARAYVVAFAAGQYAEPTASAELDLQGGPKGLKVQVASMQTVKLTAETARIAGQAQGERVTRFELDFADARLPETDTFLQPGDAVVARIHLPKRRALSLLFDVLRRVFGANSV